MVNLKKLFKLPSPIDLGKSKTSALPLRRFNKNTDRYCWEDYYKDLERDYPYKYFFLLKVPRFIKNKISLIKNDIRHIISFIKLEHMLDLRQPKDSSDYYRGGYIDFNSKILFACFNSLVQYVESKDFIDITDVFSLEKIRADEDLLKEFEKQKQIFELYDYWKISRQRMQKELIEIYNQYKESNNESYKDFYEKKLEAFDKKEDEMLQKIIIVRKFTF